MIELKIERQPLETVIDLYSRIKEDIGEKIISIQESYPDLNENTDVRLVSLKLTMESIQTNIILFHCIGASFKDLNLWEYQDFRDEDHKEKFLNDRLYFISGDLREGVFTNTFLRFENFMKIIASSLDIRGESINRLSKDIIDSSGVEDDYKNLIDLFTYLRNTLHTGGFHNRDNVTITYKDKDYEFVKNSPNTFYNDQFLEILIKEVTDLMVEIINSEKIKTKDFIEHNYSKLIFGEE